MNSFNIEKRALVISGGGSKGAFAGGFAQHLIDDLKIDYDFLIGTSTGSLLIPHLSINKVDKIKHVYTSICQKDIYNVNPFKIKKNPDGTFKSGINHKNTIRMFMKGKKTFGEHKNLRKTISKCFSREDFEMAKANHRKVVVTVANITNTTTEYKYISDYEYEDFLDWMWASTSYVPFMSLVEKNGFEYADGGFGNYLPIEEAVNLGANVIDAIVLNPRLKNTKKNYSKNPFELFVSTMDFMNQQLAMQDVMIGHLESIYNKDVKINFYFTPRVLTKMSFYFEPKQMKAWWEEGYKYAQKEFKF